MIDLSTPEPPVVDRAMALLDDLVAALELRDAGDPDSPPWAADVEVRRLERRIMTTVRDGTWPSVVSEVPIIR